MKGIPPPPYRRSPLRRVWTPEDLDATADVPDDVQDEGWWDIYTDTLAALEEGNDREDPELPCNSTNHSDEHDASSTGSGSAEDDSNSSASSQDTASPYDDTEYQQARSRMEALASVPSDPSNAGRSVLPQPAAVENPQVQNPRKRGAEAHEDMPMPKRARTDAGQFEGPDSESNEAEAY